MGEASDPSDTADAVGDEQVTALDGGPQAVAVYDADGISDYDRTASRVGEALWACSSAGQ